MIQRKQTLFLLIAAVLSIICLCLPLGNFTSNNGITDATATFYNLWIIAADGTYNFQAWALFAVLLITCPTTLAAIFLYHNRIFQIRLCMFNILLIIGWYAVFVVLALNFKEVYGKFSPSITAVLPAVSLILHLMARKAIKADEALVRAADRIR